MPEYKVKFPVIHEGKKYMPGEPVSMKEKLAEPLLDNNVLAPVIADNPFAGQTGVTEEAIVAAIYKLDTKDKTLWTKDGVPQIQALEAILKGKVSSGDRNAAYARYQKETK